MIYLVTGTHPADLPQQDFRIQFEQVANISPAFTDWLKWMTQPSLARGLTSAETALQVLNQPPQIATTLLTQNKPKGSKVSLTKDNNYLEIIIPSEGFCSATAFLSLFTIAWLSGTYCWTVSALSAPFFNINLFFALFSLPFWAAGGFMVYTALVLMFGRTRLRLNQQQFSLNRELFRFKLYALCSDIRHNINKLIYTPKHLVKEDGELIEVKSQLIIWAGAQKYELGGNHGLSCNEPEIEWLAHELSDWLGLPITRE